MSKRDSVESSGQSSINPSLQAALSNLDVQLENELARYRQRKQAERTVKPKAHSRRQQVSQPLELFELTNSAAATAFSSATPAEEISAAENPQATAQDLTEQAQQSEAFAHHAGEEREVSSLVHQPAQTGVGDLVDPASNQILPEDYLESSEQLLRSLAKEESARKTRASWMDNLLTPWRVGSILVLLFAGTLLGAALLKPESFGYLGLDRQKNSTTTAQNPTVSSPTDFDLAREELEELDLDTLSTLEANPNPSGVSSPTTPTSPVESPSPEVLEDSPDLTQMSPSPSSQLEQTPPSAAPSPEATAQPQPSPSPPENTQPKPSPSPESAAVNALPAPTRGDSYYYVLSDYADESSLKQAQAIVPEAYLRNFPQGVQIQMGAFDTESGANKLVERLKQQGILASIYRP